ncbi:MAG: hypothetical protein AABY22_31350, partial [Nanoarchaeota archaeon]
MAKRIVENFNNPDESQRITAFSVLKQFIIGPQFRIDSIEDVNAYIDSIMQMVNSTPSTKKAEIVSMLKKTLKFADDNSAERQKEYSAYEGVTKEVYNYVRASLKDLLTDQKLGFVNVLNNGKPGDQTFEDLATEIRSPLERMLVEGKRYYNSYVEDGDMKDRGIAISLPEGLLKNCERYLEELNKAAWHYKMDESIHKKIAIAKAGIGTIHNVWYAFYDTYITKNLESAKKHAEFLTPDALQKLFNVEIKKLGAIKYFINSGMLQDPSVNSSTPIKAYLGNILNIINAAEASFAEIVKKAKESSVNNPTAFSSNYTITTPTLKAFITNPTLLKALNFTDLESFKSSLNSFYLKIDSGLKNLINGNTAFDSKKDE